MPRDFRNARAIRSVPVDTAAPATGQPLVYDSATGSYSPSTDFQTAGVTTSGDITSRSSNANANTVDKAFDGGSTSDSVATNLATLIAIPDDAGGVVYADVVGTKDDGAIVYTVSVAVPFAKVAGVLTLGQVEQATVRPVPDSASVAGMDATLVASGSDVAVQVTGQAGVTYRWGVGHEVVYRKIAA